MSNKLDLIPRLKVATDNIWKEYIDLAAEYNPVDLGLGFPDFLPPKIVTNALSEVLESHNPFLHQYTKSTGHPRLVNILAKWYSKFLDREINPETEILTTLGASEALYCAVLGLVDKGDEVVLIEPYYDAYVTLIRMAGGIPKFVALKPKSNGDESSSEDWVINKEQLVEAFTDNTKAIILNNPNNPLGKVYSLKELILISDLCRIWDAVCISDEVYEFLVYKPKEHIRIASLRGMWERTVTVGSAGKSFGITGWKVGWVYGDAKLINALHILHHCAAFTGSTPLQEAIAIVLEDEFPKFGQPNSYLSSMVDDLKNKRDFIVQKLTEIQMKPTVPEGGAFIIAEWSQLESRIDLSKESGDYKDLRLTKWLTRVIGVQGIPITVFFTKRNKKIGESYIRFCFNKKEETLEKAVNKLNMLKTWNE